MIHKTLHAIVDFVRDESGPTSIEYAVMLALIASVCIIAVSALTASVDASFNTSAAAISDAVGN